MIEGKWKLTNEEYYLQNGGHEARFPTKLLVFRHTNSPTTGLTTPFPDDYGRVRASGTRTICNMVPDFENKYHWRQDSPLYDKTRLT